MYLGKILGIKLKLNWFLVPILALYFYIGFFLEIILIFSAVLLHELSHTLMAYLLNIKVSEIELLPFGGQAKVEDFTGLEPEKEIFIALAGPVLSFILAGFFYFLPRIYHNNYIVVFMNINFILGAFNMLPALPLDGGRVLRAVLAPWLGYRKATQRTAQAGKIIALTIFGYGIYLTYFLQNGINYIMIGIVLFWAAYREEKFLIYTFMRYLVNKKSALQKAGFLPAQQIISTPETEVKRVIELTRPTYYLMVVVMNTQHTMQGIYSEAQLIEGLLEKGPKVKMHEL